MSALHVLSWNLAGRVERQPEQAAVLAAAKWDVVCLQEVTPGTLRPWNDALRDLGLTWVVSSMDDWLPGEPPPDDRRLGVLTAGREPLEAIASAHIPWPERLLSVRVHGEFVVHNLHSPISQRANHVKIRTHRALAAYLARKRELPQLVVGDFNTPRREKADGTTWSFARDSRGRLRLDRGAPWEEAELAVLRGLEPHGYRDVFRAIHGYARDEISWSAGRSRYRLDHVVASREWELMGCGYLHEPREAGLSDHSPMWAELALR
ncbi:MAG: endonuclease/exonuclease/phosphatase family protein [Thermoleophilaceae bacterium]